MAISSELYKLVSENLRRNFEGNIEIMREKFNAKLQNYVSKTKISELGAPVYPVELDEELQAAYNELQELERKYNILHNSTILTAIQTAVLDTPPFPDKIADIHEDMDNEALARKPAFWGAGA